MSDSLQPHILQHTRLPRSSLSPRVHSNSCSLCWWYYLTISPSAAPFSFCLQSFPASGLFQRVGSLHQVAKVLELQHQHQFFPMNIQGWLPLGWTGLISLLCKGFSRVFSSITVQKHQFFGAQPALWSNSLIRTWLLEKPQTDFCLQSDISALIQWLGLSWLSFQEASLF